VKKIALFAAAALLAVGITSNANAGGLIMQSCPSEYEYAALKCGWTWHGDYVVKGFDTTATHYYTPPAPWSSCLEALSDLTSPEAEGCWSTYEYSPWWLEESPGNALTDTHLLKRCVTEISPCGDDS
jgi:hypothetical protein